MFAMNYPTLALICNLVILTLAADGLDAHQILEYYTNPESTKYTIVNQKWFEKLNADGLASSTADNDAAKPNPLAAIYRVPRKLSKTNKNNEKLNAHNENELHTTGDLLPPLNPAPMLHPNPFINEVDMQIRFATNNEIDYGADDSPPRQEEGSFCRRSFDRRSGYCILAHRCLHVIREYRKHGTTIDVCTYRKHIPVICCPLEDKHVDEQRISAKKCREYYPESLKNIKIGVSRKFSGKLCVSSMPMIVGGVPTSKGECPHMAALGWTQSKEDIKWGCGGTLISELFVLSAAHCATSNEKPPDVVRLGASNLTKSTSSQQDIKILIIILHPKYSSASYYHDIALLKLTRHVTFSQSVRPACLWQLPDIDISTVIAAGWGRTEFSGPKSEELQKVDLTLIDHNLCKTLYRRERRLVRGIIDEQLCAGHLEGGRDTCQGDSGGPLYAELPEYNCVNFIVGITSFGKFCAAPNAPGVYTKLYAYLDWIEKIVFRK